MKWFWIYWYIKRPWYKSTRRIRRWWQSRRLPPIFTVGPGKDYESLSEAITAAQTSKRGAIIECYPMEDSEPVEVGYTMEKDGWITIQKGRKLNGK